MPTFVTKLIHDTSPDFGDNPQTITESGRPESITMQGLTPNTAHYCKGEIYQDGVLNDTSEVETFTTLPAGSLSLTYYSTTRSGYLYDYVFTYSSTYAPSYATCTVNNSTFNGFFDYNQHVLNFNITGLQPSTTYPTVVTLADIYGETVTVNGSITTTYVNSISIIDTDADENFVDVGLTYVVDGGFYNGWVDVWYDYQDPSTDLSLQHYFFSEGDTVIHCDGLADDTGYLFRASITLDDRTTVINSNVVDVDTLEATYLSITDISGVINTLKLTKTNADGNAPTVALEYSTDKVTWTTWEENNNERSIAIPANGTVYLRGNNANGFGYDNNNKHVFSSTGNVEANGDLMRIINKDRGGATAIPANGFRNLFNGMSTLKKAPAISATTYGNYCCTTMYQGTGLTDLSNFKISNPTFPSGAGRQFFGMFLGCRSLTSANVQNIFNKETLVNASNAYNQMFAYCTGLTSTPEFTITSTSDTEFTGMFQNCSALTDLSKIHFNATTLNAGAFMNMFQNCTSLTTGLDIRNVTSIGNNAISNMYSGCTSLNVAYAPTVTWNTAKSNNWLNNVAATGTLYADKSIINSIPTSNASGCPTGWNMYENEYIDKYFTVKNESNTTNDITITSTAPPMISVYVSTDNGNTWTEKSPQYASSTVNNLGTLDVGEKMLIKHTGNFSPNNSYRAIIGSAAYSVEGNIASLCFGDNFIGSLTASDYCLRGLFYNSSNLLSAENLKFDSFTTLGQSCYQIMFENCTSLTTAPSLPATSLANYCYGEMFNGCKSLTTAPSLPATSLAYYCYDFMFASCTSLTTAPSSLPATTLEVGCYKSMFSGCTLLTTAPSLPATSLAYYCYRGMFRGCTSLTTAPSLPATTLAEECYYEMFKNCTSLVNAPTISATTLAEECCREMFYGCSSLTNAPELRATTLTQYCYQRMFQNCTSLTIAPVLPATSLANYCYDYMFSGCTSLTTAPSLPATSLANYCYDYMFSGCTSLTTAPELRATSLAIYCYAYMLYGCSSLTTAPSLPATSIEQGCYQGMFENCTSLTTAPSLPATTLAYNCYDYMFYGCSSLTTAPNLPAKTLILRCYEYMFQNCSKINSITVGATSWNTSYTRDWVSGVSATGTFTKPSGTSIPTGTSGIPNGWTVVNV